MCEHDQLADAGQRLRLGGGVNTYQQFVGAKPKIVDLTPSHPAYDGARILPLLFSVRWRSPLRSLSSKKLLDPFLP